MSKTNRIKVEIIDHKTGVMFDQYHVGFPVDDPDSEKKTTTILNFNDRDYYYVRDNGRDLEKIGEVTDPVIPIRWITRQWIQKILDAEGTSSVDILQMELNHLVKMYEEEYKK
jgi:hypothetical protein